MFEGNHLTRYYASVDAGDFAAATEALAPDVRFAIHLPGGVRRGSTSSELIDYLAGRGVVDRVHHPLRTGIDDDVEFVYGEVTQGGAATGRFLASVRVDDGLITHYHVSFDTELSLLEEASR